MRTLVLMRHATTEPSHPQGDLARQLLPRGQQEAKTAGEHLSALGLETALVSVATRTRETFEALELAVPVSFHKELYYGGVDTACELIAATPMAVTGMLVVGHAPTIPGLVMQLAAAAGLPADTHHFPTATYAVFQLRSSWASLVEETPELSFDGIYRPS